MNKKLTEETRRFLKKLDRFLIHLSIYLVVNMALAIYTFTDFTTNWWILFPMICWALLLLYHAMEMKDQKGRIPLRKALLLLLSPS